MPTNALGQFFMDLCVFLSRAMLILSDIMWAIISLCDFKFSDSHMYWSTSLLLEQVLNTHTLERLAHGFRGSSAWLTGSKQKHHGRRKKHHSEAKLLVHGDWKAHSGNRKGLGTGCSFQGHTSLTYSDTPRSVLYSFLQQISSQSDLHPTLTVHHI